MKHKRIIVFESESEDALKEQVKLSVADAAIGLKSCDVKFLICAYKPPQSWVSDSQWEIIDGASSQVNGDQEMIKVTQAQLEDFGISMIDLGLMETTDLDNEDVTDEWSEAEIESGRDGNIKSLETNDLVHTGSGVMTAKQLGESILNEAAAILGVDFEVVA